MWRLLAVAGGLAALTACPGVEDDDEPGNGGRGNPCGWETACIDVEDPSIDVTWNADGFVIVLDAMDTTGFDLGLAETADMAGGWFGEDCLYGTAEHRLCHVFNGTRVGELASVDDIEQVVPGETTWFDQASEARLTYVVTIDSGECWVWGNDPSYYLGDPSFDGCGSLN